MTGLRICAAGVAFLLSFSAYSEILPSFKDGGSVVIPQEYGSDHNEGSSLRRSWVTLDDVQCPLEIIDAGISIPGERLNTWFRAAGHVKPRLPISAFEVRFILIDVFGNFIRTLSHTVFKDFSADVEVPLTDSWSVQSDHDLLLVHTVVAFVAQVRTSEGSIWRYDVQELVESFSQIGLPTGEALRELEENVQ